MLCLLLALLMGVTSGRGPETANVDELLSRLKAQKLPGRTEYFRIAEGQINQFLASVAREPNRFGIRDLRVQLENSGAFRLVARIRIEDVRVPGKLVSATRSLLSGDQLIEIEARLITQAGKARFELQTARLNSVPLPPWLATSLIAYLARLQPPYVDPTEDFSLPYGITGISITADQLEIFR